MLAKLKRKLMKDCGKCCLSWEERSYEGDCDCGCVLYGDDGHVGIACFLPNLFLRRLRARKDRERDEALAREGEGMYQWTVENETKDALFLQALRDRMFVDKTGNPKQPLYRAPNGKYWPYEPTDGWSKARRDYEKNLEDGLPPLKAFKKAIAEYMTPELYYDCGDGTCDTFLIFTNCQAAMDGYNEKLKEAGLEPAS